MVEIDFNRMMESAKDELQLTKALFMPEQKRQEYYKERRDRTEKRFYEQGGRHDSNRQLYMLKLVTTPLIENGLMPKLKETTEMGNGYQPDPNTPLVFVPQYNNHINMYYKGYNLFDMEMTSGGNIKAATIVDQTAKDILASISNHEWNDTVSKVVPELLSDGKRDQMTVMMTKTDTEYIQALHGHIAATNGEVVKINDVFAEKPDVQAQVNSISDEDLQQMYESMMQGQSLESDAIDHQFGG